ncbi:MFS transporter [Eubacteriales bacterium KG127]
MKKILNIYYGGIHGTYWMYYGIIGSFASVFLIAKGYSSGRIGVIVALGCILAVMLQPFMADLGDRSKKISVFGISQIVVVVMLVGTVILLFPDKHSLGLSILFILLIAWVTALQPLINYMVFKLSTTGYHINFGLARSCGSLGYALLCICLGYFVEKYGVVAIPVAGIIILVALAGFLLYMKRSFLKAIRLTGKGSLLNGKSLNTAREEILLDHSQDSNPQAKACLGPEITGDSNIVDEEITLLKFAKKNKMFFMLNVGFIFVFFNNGVLNSFLYQIVTDVGGNSSDMGTIFSLMAFCEIPTLVFFDKIMKKFSCETLMKIASISFLLKILAFFFAKSITFMYLAQVFQPLSFAVFLPAVIHFTDQVMKKGEAVKGQALFTIMMSLATVVSSFCGGFIIDILGEKELLLVSVMVSVIGVFMTFYYVDKVPKKEI